MRVAVLSDVHGNAPALAAVLADLEQREPDVVVCCGDVAAGPMPAQTIELLRDIGETLVAVRGNADREAVEVFDGRSTDDVPPDSRWAGRQITHDQRDWLDSLPLTATLECGQLGTVMFCHATPRDDAEIVVETTPNRVLRRQFAGVAADVVVCGNTHMQFDRAVDRRRLVNAGSVGMPYGQTGAFWALLDDDVEFCRTSYDLAGAARTIRDESEWELANEFAEDNVLRVPSRAEALALFESLAAEPGEMGRPPHRSASS